MTIQGLDRIDKTGIFPNLNAPGGLQAFARGVLVAECSPGAPSTIRAIWERKAWEAISQALAADGRPITEETGTWSPAAGDGAQGPRKAPG
jgi:hypothetical protein